MALDQLIQKRFQELDRKAQEVRKARYLDFTSHEGIPYYGIPYAAVAGWATSVQNLLVRSFGQESVHLREFQRVFGAFDKWESAFDSCVAVFAAAKEDYEGGYLFSVRSLIKAEVLEDAIEQAKELLRVGLKDPAAILARVALEVTLKEMCTKADIPTAKLDKMNVDLCKAGVYNMAKQKLITAWAEIGNKAAHGQWQEYSEQDASSMITDVEHFMAEYL